jgi:hypothetical protein
MPERDDAQGRARKYIDAAQTVSFPPSRPIGEAPREPERTLLLYCPEQGGWQSGEWRLGEWTDTLTGGKSLKPTHWMEPPPPVPVETE